MPLPVRSSKIHSNRLLTKREKRVRRNPQNLESTSLEPNAGAPRVAEILCEERYAVFERISMREQSQRCPTQVKQPFRAGVNSGTTM